jgi:hypothetical protein
MLLVFGGARSDPTTGDWGLDNLKKTREMISKMPWSEDQQS